MPAQPTPPPAKPVKFDGPGRTAAVVSWDGIHPAILHLGMRPSTSSPSRVRAVLLQPLTDPTTATDETIHVAPFADFRLEMN